MGKERKALRSIDPSRSETASDKGREDAVKPLHTLALPLLYLSLNVERRSNPYLHGEAHGGTEECSPVTGEKSVWFSTPAEGRRRKK